MAESYQDAYFEMAKMICQEILLVRRKSQRKNKQEINPRVKVDETKSNNAAENHQ